MDTEYIPSAAEYIPPATAEKLAAVHPNGTRHKAAMDIALPLIGQGISESQVFTTLRGKFDADMPDKELEGIVRWAASKKPTPAVLNGNGYRQQFQPSNGYNRAAAPAPKPRPAVEQALWWTSGEQLSPESLSALSPIPIPELQQDRATLALQSLYADTDNLNVVCQFTRDEGNAHKTRPQGKGRTQSSTAWLKHIESRGVPSTEAGAWVRMNPCTATGSGADGAITDADVTAFRFLLVESDSIPLPVQLGLFARLKLPIAVILLSGGLSAHAWVRVDCPNAQTYKATAEKILALLKPFGVDQANKNPSRLSRLPGATRVIGASGDGIQSLLWLNPAAPAVDEHGLAAFEESLQFPAIQDKPLRAIAQRAIDRYEEMSRNVGKLGIPTGIAEFDETAGGIKPGQTVVIAGITGGCKSTLALHMIKTALDAGHGVVLFSLEMDEEEVFDLMMADKSSVDRNKFNNGKFHKFDFEQMIKAMGPLSKLPLYIEDSPMTNLPQIRARTLQLKAANKIGLAVVDYVQFVSPEWTKETREQQVATISHGLRALARETRIPVIVLSQLNDEGKLRESRVIAHNANIVFLVEVEGDILKVKIVKGRGVDKATYELEFNKLYARLVSKQRQVSPYD